MAVLAETRRAPERDGGARRTMRVGNPACRAYQNAVAKLYDSEYGAKVVILSADHCPPHVHAAHKGEGWVARLWFSFQSRTVGILEIAPTSGAVRQKQLNQLLDELAENLPACRKLWWEGKGTTCLENQWLVRVRPGQWELPGQRRAGARQVRAAEYRTGDQTTSLTFWDGTRDVMGSGDGG